MGKKNKCKIISFGYINYYILLIPLGVIFICALELFPSLSDKLSQEINKSKCIQL